MVYGGKTQIRQVVAIIAISTYNLKIFHLGCRWTKAFKGTKTHGQYFPRVYS